MPFVIGWIVASIATPLVNWLEKRMKIVKKLGSALIVILVLGGNRSGTRYFARQPAGDWKSTGLSQGFSGSVCSRLESRVETDRSDTLSGVFDRRLPEGMCRTDGHQLR